MENIEAAEGFEFECSTPTRENSGKTKLEKVILGVFPTQKIKTFFSSGGKISLPLKFYFRTWEMREKFPNSVDSKFRCNVCKFFPYSHSDNAPRLERPHEKLIISFARNHYKTRNFFCRGWKSIDNNYCVNKSNVFFAFVPLISVL